MKEWRELECKRFEFNLFDHNVMEGVIEILEKDQNIHS